MPENFSLLLSELRKRLHYLNESWTINDYESLLAFFVKAIPELMHAERCSIFISEEEGENIWLKFGTGLTEKSLIPPKKGTIVGKSISTGKCVIENDIKRESGYHDELRASTGFVTRNIVCAPIRSLTGHGVTGAIEVLNKNNNEGFTEQDGIFLQEISSYLSMSIENIIINQEILKVSEQLSNELDIVQASETPIIAKSPVMRNIINTVTLISTTPVNVLIQGESGTGKEVIARMIHSQSDRKDAPFIPVNCAAIPENLAESEFFGYEKGAFTGAIASRGGRFEEADGGILFLDEIGDMPLSMQPKLLRVLQEGEGRRLGSNRSVRYDFRVISATNRDLRRETEAGNFREDLFYRIFSVEIYIPPLRERREDIIPLATFFLNNASSRFGRKTAGFSSEVLKFFEDYEWPGNVRQLQHEVERLVALTPKREQLSMINCSPDLQIWKKAHTAKSYRNIPDLTLPEKVRRLEIECIGDALSESGGSKVKAARILGITRQGLDKKLKRYNISRSPSNS